MIAKDWIAEAAEEIAQWKPGEDVITIIRRHIPYADNVVYMPVPRCDGCKHCNRNLIPGGGICTHPQLNVSVDEPLETGEDFGCVQFEASVRD